MPSLEELVSSEESRSPRFPWRRVALVATLLLLLVMAVFLPPYVNLGKYRRSITASMSEALGRPVYVGGMQLRLLPTPGIVMSDFTVDEDPAFGYEPALHATSVVASLRLTSLWRGRLEVSRISLDEASLNLVRNDAGQWSITSILLRASQIPNAPTGERRLGPRPRFPYIEATDARIDFKDGVEKKPFSLMSAEFSMWQAGADEWRLRLRAQPVRTDLELHLSDTGELIVEGSLRRAPVLDAIPVDLRVEWAGAQLGQVSRLFAGMDSGWRGDLDVTAVIRGNLGDLSGQSRVRVGDLRRQEFQPASTMDVDATCRSQYHRATHVFDNITCFWPVAGGHLLLTGSVQGFQAPQSDLRLEINQVPAAFPAHFLELIRPGAQNVTAAGTINGNFRLVTAGRPRLSGDATATGIALRYRGGNLSLPPLHFVAPPPPPAPARRSKRNPPPVPTPPIPVQNAIQLLPVSIPLGEPEPLVAEARFSRAGFEIHAAGSAALARLQPAGAQVALFGNALAAVAPRGRATLNITAAGPWMRPLSGTSPGIGATGTVEIEGAQLRPAFLAVPVDIESAQVQLAPDAIAWQNVSFSWQKMPMQGSIRFPATCNQPVACPVTFTLTAGSLDAAAIQTAFAGNAGNGFLGQIIDNALGGEHLAPWPSLQGEFRCDVLDLGQLTLREVTTAVAVEGNKLSLSSFDASALGGTLHASGAMAVENAAPHWQIRAHVDAAESSQMASLFDEQWGSGVVNGEADLKMTGYRTEDLASSATGDFSFTWQNGALETPGAASDNALGHFERWTAKGSIAGRALTLTGGGMLQTGRTNPVRGTISFDRDLDLTVQTRRGALKVDGTLAHPQVSSAPTAP